MPHWRSYTAFVKNSTAPFRPCIQICLPSLWACVQFELFYSHMVFMCLEFTLDWFSLLIKTKSNVYFYKRHNTERVDFIVWTNGIIKMHDKHLTSCYDQNQLFNCPQCNSSWFFSMWNALLMITWYVWTLGMCRHQILTGWNSWERGLGWFPDQDGSDYVLSSSSFWLSQVTKRDHEAAAQESILVLLTVQTFWIILWEYVLVRPGACNN